MSGTIAAIERFADRMNALWREPLADAERWQRVKALMPILLDDPVLRKNAARWDDTNGDGSTTVKNLLLYEDPANGWVINSLVKAWGGEVPPHDHAHTWTAYGVIEGSEKIVRYEIVEGTRDADYAKVRETTETPVLPGFVDVVGPYDVHAEIATAGRTVAIIVRSQKLGTAIHAAFNNATGVVRHVPGPPNVPIALHEQPEEIAR
jgi:predicted metal-dependent enzyme (double-stranded beta helix superfamily)